MTARIRGHYRIDALGRVVPVTDVNSSLQNFVVRSPLPPDRAADQRTQLTRLCMVGGLLCMLGLVVMASLPQIQNAIVARESARMASIRKSFVKAHPGFEARAAHRWNRAMMADAERSD